MRNTILVRDPFREFDSLVRTAFGPRAFAPTAQQGQTVAYAPAVDSHRDGDDAVLRFDLPGVDVAEDVDIELRDQQLVVSGTRRSEHEEESDGRHLREVRHGSFRRSFRVGAQVGADAVSASYDQGVLTIRVAGVYAEPAGQRIAISTGDEGNSLETGATAESAGQEERS